MSSTVLYVSLSLDGFVTGPNEGPDNGLGDGGEVLHEWIFHGTGDHPKEAVGALGDVNSQIVDEAMSTRAVITGRRNIRGRHRLGWRPPRRRAPLRPQPQPTTLLGGPTGLLCTM